MFIAIVCKPGYDVMDFEVEPIFLIKPFFLHDQKSRQKLKYLENENSSQDEIKSIFCNFQKAFNKVYNTKLFWKVRVRLLNT